MRFLSLCSGIEAASAAWISLGMECAAVAEIEPFPCAVLKHHYPAVPNLGNVEGIIQQQIEQLNEIHITVFGFPCTDVSVAGLRTGFNHADGTITRSGLFHTCLQISDWAKSRFVLVENVPGLFSSNGGRDFASVVGGLAGAKIDVPGDGWRNTGVALGPKGLVEWVVLDAQWFGLAQRRKRVFIVRDSGDWPNRPPLFLNAARLSGHPAPSRQAWQGTPYSTSPSLTGSGRGTERAGESRGQDGVIPIQEIGQRQSGTPQNGVGHGAAGDPMFTLQAASVHGVCYTLRAEHDASEDGTGRGVPFVLAHGQANSEIVRDGSPSLTCNHKAPIAFHPRIARNGRGDMGDKVNALNAQSGQTGKGDAAPDYAVRRLTVGECEILMGFPKGWTDITYRGKPAADGPRYRSLGNSIAVPVLKWLGERLKHLTTL